MPPKPSKLSKLPTAAQVLAAKVRAAVEAYELKHRKVRGGEITHPPRDEVYTAVAAEVGVPFRAISFCMTFSRSCTHSWAKGACAQCPAADHIPF